MRVRGNAPKCNAPCCFIRKACCYYTNSITLACFDSFQDTISFVFFIRVTVLKQRSGFDRIVPRPAGFLLCDELSKPYSGG